MNRRRPPIFNLNELREQAEQRLADRAPVDTAAVSDMLHQLHELQVSQIELEMQNAALMQLEAEREFAASGRDRYAQLYDEAPASYFSLGPDGRIARANRAAGVMMGRSVQALLGRPFEQFVAPEEQAGLRRFLADVFETGRRCVLETTLFGSGLHVRIEANLDPEQQKCRLVATDMGDAVARETARRRAFEVLDCIGEGLLMCGPDQHILAVNPAFTRITGYLAEQALGRNPLFVARHDAHPAGYYQQAKATLERMGRWQGEVYCRRRDGVPFVVSLSMTVQYGEDGNLASYIGVFADITARKQAEAELLALSRELDARVVSRTAELVEANRRLQEEVAERMRAEAELHESREQLRKLADHLQVMKEEERKRIARDIHDELGQNLLALRLDVVQLHQRSGQGDGPLHQRTSAALNNLDGAIRSVRGIMNELRPAVLDLGLLAAIEWQATEFRKRSGAGCQLLLLLPPETAAAAISEEMAIVLFRSLQEALGNVAHHAQASSVTVALEIGGGGLTLTVSDNGVGIAPADRLKSGAFGLVGIAERVVALGGRFELAPYSPGAGCILRLRFDLVH